MERPGHGTGRKTHDRGVTRSISPPMMTSAIVSATMLFSIESWNRLTKFPTLRKYGDPTLLNARRRDQERASSFPALESLSEQAHGRYAPSLETAPLLLRPASVLRLPPQSWRSRSEMTAWRSRPPAGQEPEYTSSQNSLIPRRKRPARASRSSPRRHARYGPEPPRHSAAGQRQLRPR